jgi:predicted metal-dependent hydrolase
MSKEEEVYIKEYPEFGKVHFRKSRRSRYIRISINRERVLRVIYPGSVSIKAAEGFLLSKKSWVIKHLQHRNDNSAKPQLYSQESDCFSRKHRFKFVLNGLQKPGFKIVQDTVFIYLPEQLPIENEMVQNTIRKSLIETWRKEAKAILVPRTLELAEKFNFKVSGVSIKNATTRWGSCSHKNNINLSLHLIRLPDHLIDYVILHELVHTKIKNHQTGFWEALNSITGNSKELRKQMKKYSLGIW